MYEATSQYIVLVHVQELFKMFLRRSKRQIHWAFLKLSTPCTIAVNHFFSFQLNAHYTSSTYIYHQLSPTFNCFLTVQYLIIYYIPTNCTNLLFIHKQHIKTFVFFKFLKLLLHVSVTDWPSSGRYNIYLSNWS